MFLKILDKIWLFLRFIDFRIIEYADEIPYEIRSFFRRFSMAFSYFKISFYCDSDYAVTPGLLMIMSHKLRRVEKEMRHLVNSGKYKREINWAIAKLHDIANSRYENAFRNAHEKKWGIPKIGTKDNRFVLSYPKAQTRAEKEQARKELLEYYRKAAELRNKNFVEVMNFIAKKADCWWD